MANQHKAGRTADSTSVAVGACAHCRCGGPVKPCEEAAVGGRSPRSLCQPSAARLGKQLRFCLYLLEVCDEQIILGTTLETMLHILHIWWHGVAALTLIASLSSPFETRLIHPGDPNSLATSTHVV